MGNEEASLSTVAVLTLPLSLDGVNMNCGEVQKQHNILSRVLNLFKSVRPGADLTRFQLPPNFNMPKSQLQVYGESVYCSSQDLLSKCVEGGNEVERFKAVVAWSISITRPTIFAKVPYNPILGETHHVSSGNLNVLLEQALKPLDPHRQLKSIIKGRSVEATVHGKRILKLPAFGERYEMNCPKLSIRFFPRPSTEWVGIVTVQCKESGLKATLCYNIKSLFGLKGSSTRITGKIFKTNFPAQHHYELDGNWDQTVMVMDIKSGKTNMLYDAKATITKLKTPIVQNPRVPL
eukprot:Gb_23063 [translate_table: standard]